MLSVSRGGVHFPGKVTYSFSFLIYLIQIQTLSFRLASYSCFYIMLESRCQLTGNCLCILTTGSSTVIVTGFRSVVNADPLTAESFFYLQNNVCLLRLFQVFLQSVFQLTLQIYIIYVTGATWLTSESYYRSGFMFSEMHICNSVIKIQGRILSAVRVRKTLQSLVLTLSTLCL